MWQHDLAVPADPQQVSPCISSFMYLKNHPQISNCKIQAISKGRQKRKNEYYKDKMSANLR